MQSGTINNEGNDLKTYDSESSLVRGGSFQREEGAVVSHLTFPMTVEIVGHDVEKVDVLDHFGNIVTGSNGFRAGRDGSRQQETWQFVGNGFSLKGQTQFFDQIEEGRPVIRTSANFSKNTQIKMGKKGSMRTLLVICIIQIHTWDTPNRCPSHRSCWHAEIRSSRTRTGSCGRCLK